MGWRRRLLSICMGVVARGRILGICLCVIAGGLFAAVFVIVPGSCGTGGGPFDAGSVFPPCPSLAPLLTVLAVFFFVAGLGAFALGRSWADADPDRADAARLHATSGGPPASSTGTPDEVTLPGRTPEVAAFLRESLRLGTTPEQAARLQATGEQADATVLSASRVPLPPGVLEGGSGIYDLVLDVARADGTHYQTTTRMRFISAEGRDRVTRPGAEIPLRIDPADLTRVIIDTAALGFS